MVEETAEEKRPGLAPWEQHSAVISLPRFDYKAPSSLLDRSHSGFLITCTIKREKSATKEAISILEKYIGAFSCDDPKVVDPHDRSVATKKRKTNHEDNDKREDSKEAGSVLETSGENCKLNSTLSASADVDAENGVISLVKLSKSGLLLFTFRRNDGLDTIGILSNIFESLCLGNLKPPLWCHRIFPIQATCCLKEKDLQVTVSRLIQQFLDDEQNKLGRPIKFAVGYNRRGIDETAEIKIQKSTSPDGNKSLLLDRNRCFSVVAGTFHEVAVDSVVDLKSPEVAVFVELLPISGVPNRSPVVAVSVLPHNLFTTKPRLSVKALDTDAKTTQRSEKTAT